MRVRVRVCVCVCEIWSTILQGKPDVSVTSTEEPNLFIAVGEVYLYICVCMCAHITYIIASEQSEQAGLVVFVCGQQFIYCNVSVVLIIYTSMKFPTTHKSSMRIVPHHCARLQ